MIPAARVDFDPALPELAIAALAALAALAWIWQPMLAISVHDELAAAEGVDRERTRAVFVLLLALVVAIAMKIVGVLLTVAFLIIPAAAARPLASTPERMVVYAAAAGAIGVAGGLALSLWLDTPGGPSIVVVLALLAGLSLVRAARRV